MVLRLAERGLTPRRIEAVTGIPRSTVRRWRRGESLSTRRPPYPPGPGWRPPSGSPYAYLLGLYLGDGHIAAPRGHPFLRIFLDRRYAAVVEDAATALQTTFPDARVRRYEPNRAEMSILQVSHPALVFAFPQHGPGRKHMRPIVLADWQARITRRWPDQLIRGLIHSDGCRCVNRFSVDLPSGRIGHYEYVRYFFSNLSEDIRGIYCDHCDLLGIRWSQSNARNISISHRRSVALMEDLVGPKR